MENYLPIYADDGRTDQEVWNLVGCFPQLVALENITRGIREFATGEVYKKFCDFVSALETWAYDKLVETHKLPSEIVLRDTSLTDGAWQGIAFHYSPALGDNAELAGVR